MGAMEEIGNDVTSLKEVLDLWHLHKTDSSQSTSTMDAESAHSDYFLNSNFIST